MSAPEGPQDPEEETSENTDNDATPRDAFDESFGKGMEIDPDESGESEPTDESVDEESDDEDEDDYDAEWPAPPPPPPPPPWIDIVLKEQSGGMVDSQLLIGFKPSEEALEKVADYKNPCFLIIVASVNEESRYEQEEKYTYYYQKSAYILPFKSRQKVQWIRFNRPDKHRIFVTIVDIHDKWSTDRAKQYETNRFHALGTTGKLDVSLRHEGLGHRDVIVPKGAFSEPAAWKRNLVRQFWRNIGSDDCNLRKKLWFGAIPLTVLVQLYGFPVRFLMLALALIMGKREIRLRLLGAFNPHMVWKASGDSWWFTDKQGKDRKVLRWISPPVFGGLAAVFLGIPGVIYGIADMPWYGNNHEPRHAAVWAHNWGYWHTVAVLDRWIVLLAAVAGVVFGIGWFVAAIIHRLRQNRLEETQEERLARLKTRLGNIPEDGPDWDSLPDSQKTVRLRFANLKSKVCRPIAA